MAQAEAPVSLEAKSPFEMRVKLGETVPETDVRTALKTGDMGFLHSFTTGSAVDGPGLRLVAWTTACMFRCQFCHNPDTWTLANGIPVALDRAVSEIQRYANSLKLMHGGFTLSGGEPLMQDRFAARLLGATKKMGVHTALETNGYYGERLSDEEWADVDLVILDMKGFALEQHKRVTGGLSNEPVMEFARRLSALKRPMWLRYVLVPGLTDVDEEMKPLAEFAASLGVVERAEVLPFHQLGRYKWERLGLTYQLEDTEPPTQQSIDHATAIFAAAGL
ncbi:pyruvate formate lyase-activating protein [Croceibacterium sp. LX-88]|uniref:Pyruvate formate-lyase-activating enzyme n=1 Tax=Croceibacterium selenioxidans TaxID=2838833 RepID=A0ABS5W1J7_9SPHN|nr:pyruvate formate-lyase-activating protein [Croceibacterium selenioxidans]MBT2133641.1 pyruvate formate lyase-activating protein [Croceibacterium selenioxidans]